MSNVSRLVPDYDPSGNSRAPLLGTRLPSDGPEGPVAVTRGGHVGMVMASGRIDYLGVAGSSQDALPEDEVDLAAKGLVNRPIKVDPLNDLSFDVYQDPETAVMTRRVARLKQECVRQEKFQKAKQCNEIITGLRRVGEELGRLGVIKKRAIEAEDFDTAEAVRSQIIEFREKIYTTLGVRELFQEHPSRTPGLSSGRKERKTENFGSKSHSDKQRQGSRKKGAPRLPRTPPLPGIGSVTTASRAGTASRFSTPTIKLVDTQSHHATTSQQNEVVVTMNGLHVKLYSQAFAKKKDKPNIYVVLKTNPRTIFASKKDNVLKTQRALKMLDHTFEDTLTCSLTGTEAAQNNSDFVLAVMDYDRFAEDQELGCATLGIRNLRRGAPFSYGPAQGGVLVKGQDTVGTVECTVLLENRSAFDASVAASLAAITNEVLRKEQTFRADSPASVVLTSPTESPAPLVAAAPPPMAERVTPSHAPTSPTPEPPFSPDAAAASASLTVVVESPFSEVASLDASLLAPSPQPVNEMPVGSPDLMVSENPVTPEKEKFPVESKSPSLTLSATGKERSAISLMSPTSDLDFPAVNSPESQAAAPATAMSPDDGRESTDILKEEVRYEYDNRLRSALFQFRLYRVTGCAWILNMQFLVFLLLL